MKQGKFLTLYLLIDVLLVLKFTINCAYEVEKSIQNRYFYVCKSITETDVKIV